MTRHVGKIEKEIHWTASRLHLCVLAGRVAYTSTGQLETADTHTAIDIFVMWWRVQATSLPTCLHEELG